MRLLRSRGGVLVAGLWALFLYGAIFSDWVDQDDSTYRPAWTYQPD